MDYHKNLLLFRLEDIEQWQSKGNKVPEAVKNKVYSELNDVNKQIASYQLYINVAEGSLYNKIKYLITPCKIWLHNKLLYRIYNLLKMYHLLNEKPKRKVIWNNIETQKDNRVITLTLKDFIEKKELF